MDRRRFLQVALAGASSGLARAQQAKAGKLTLDLKGAGPKISRHLYGHFAEHLGHCIYEGLWVGEDSPIPNTRGVRNDVVAALRKMKIPNLRWPGGCFADTYHWRAGIGPRQGRPKTVNMHWGGVIDPNTFGTHEFMDFCDQTGAEPYIAANVGSGTPREMFEWIEYLTFDGESTLAEERAKNGHPAPWKVPFLGVGNENWGCGGNMTADYYSDMYRRFAVYARGLSGNDLTRVAGGPGGGDLEWIETLMERIHSNMEAVSLHYYTIGSRRWADKGPSTGFGEDGWIAILDNALRIKTILADTIRIMDHHDPDNRVKLFVDEWGTWYHRSRAQSGVLVPGKYDSRRARGRRDAAHLPRERRAGEDGQLGAVGQCAAVADSHRGRKDGAHADLPRLEMMSVHHDSQALPLDLDTPYYTAGDKINPALSASASATAAARPT